MTGTSPPQAPTVETTPVPPVFDTRPPGERYFRHPGDAVRLVVWGLVTALLAVIISLATSTSNGVTADLGRAAARVPTSVRELALALAQVGAVLVPAAVVIVLMIEQRWRRLGLVLLAGACGAAFFALLDALLDLPGRVPGAVTDGTWVASTRFPSLAYVAGAAAATAVGKPWLGRPWRRAADIGLVVLGVIMAIAGSAGVPELALALASGLFVGAALLVAFGAPNRRPSPAAVAAALGDAGLFVSGLTLERAEGGRAQLYVANGANGDRAFVKVYAQDSRDADLLYRGYRTAILRQSTEDRPSVSLDHDVEHQAFLLLLAREAGVTVPAVEALTRLPDGSMVLALDYVDGRRLDELSPDEIDAELLDALWHEVAVMHGGRLAHRSLRAANVLVDRRRPVIIDLGFGEESAAPRLHAIDRAELLVSLAELVGAEPVVTSAARHMSADELAAAAPYLQPLALSAATRKHASKSLLQDLRSQIAAITGEEPPPLERLVRVRARTLVMIAALTAAFYVLLPQLAHVDDSFAALGHADWPWLIVCILMSLLTYVAAAIGLSGGVPQPLPFVANVETQMASSFVNRVTPANVGGMALNLRFLQKAGIDPAAGVTGIGLNVVAGALVHVLLLFVFIAWAGQSDTNSFKIPSSSKVLVAIAVVLALVGIAIATRWGRRILQKHVLGFLKRSWASIVVLARSPAKLVALVGGSTLVTLAYIAALAAAITAFDGGVSFAQVGAVYLGASMVAAAAPTPGGLGALEAALVAGFTGVGMKPGIAVAAVLAYRLATYWFPILPGWLSFQHLERRNLI
jgi:undecaprenyl-diphosphatase